MSHLVPPEDGIFCYLSEHLDRYVDFLVSPWPHGINAVLKDLSSVGLEASSLMVITALDQLYKFGKMEMGTEAPTYLLPFTNDCHTCECPLEALGINEMTVLGTEVCRSRALL